MAKNTFVTQESKKPKSTKNTVFTQIKGSLAELINMENMINKIPMSIKYKVGWVLFLCLLYIAYTLKYETKVREVDNKKSELQGKKSEYIHLKTSFGQKTKKSELLEKVKGAGLNENTTAPQKLIIE